MQPSESRDWARLGGGSDDEAPEARAGGPWRAAAARLFAATVLGLLALGGYRSGPSIRGNLDNVLALAPAQPIAPPPPPYLEGWARARWIACTSSSQLCPMHVLDTPRDGCESGAALGRLLLTGDGLSSPPVRSAFQAMLHATVLERTPADQPKRRRVLLVLDAAFDAFEAGTQFLSAGGYCRLRQAELGSLGATAVVCVILDPAVRERLASAPSETRESADFAKMMSKVDDDFILDELDRSTAVFVEAGSPVILLQNVRRSLVLKKRSGHRQTSLQAIIRHRVHSRTLAYVGVSSGSSIAGELMMEMGPEDMGKVGGDISGMGLVPNCSFYPHVDDVSAAQMMHRLAAESRAGLMGVPDCQPVVNTEQREGRLRHLCPGQAPEPLESRGI